MTSVKAGVALVVMALSTACTIWLPGGQEGPFTWNSIRDTSGLWMHWKLYSGETSDTRWTRNVGKKGHCVCRHHRQRRRWLRSLQVCAFRWHGCCCCSSLSCIQLFVTPWTAGRQASLSFTISWSLFKLMSIGSVTPSHHLILCPTLFLWPSVFPRIRVFSSESTLHIRWPKYWSFSFSISRSNEYSGLISFRIDWLDLFAVREILKSLLQQHDSKASIQCLTFFTVQLSHHYMNTGKSIAFDYIDLCWQSNVSAF